MENAQQSPISGCIISILVADGVDIDAIVAVRMALKESGVSTRIVASHPGAIKSAQGIPIVTDCSLRLDESLRCDAVFIPGGNAIDRLCHDENALYFVRKAYKTGKVLASSDGGERVIIKAAQSANLPNGTFTGQGVVNHSDNDPHFFRRLAAAMAQRHFLNRPDAELI
ncbi:MAG: DJ-1/PfpI family protein [Methylophilaceae bacterium]